nr:hypothetical protein CTI12_AA248110 [Tanacetum cinerariifolium]GEX81151.1 hypothetical protein CTI12_AA248110 [Tanacetum cinerariifolium]
MISLFFNSLGKIILDVDFFIERGTSPSTGRFSWSFIDSKLFSRTFNTSTLFSMTFNTSEPSLGYIKKCRVLKLQALAWKNKSTRGNTRNVYASGTTHTFVIWNEEIQFDPNVRFSLSFNLPAIERDITNNDDVEFFIDCATNSITDEIPHLYIRPPKVEERIIPEPVGILQKALAQKKQTVIVSGCLGDMRKHCIKGKLELVVGVVKSCTTNSLGDMTVTLKDPP